MRQSQRCQHLHISTRSLGWSASRFRLLCSLICNSGNAGGRPSAETQTRTFISVEFEGADVILRADDTDFRVHTTILRQASPFFQSLFELPQPRGSDDMAVIEMTEEADVLEVLVRLIYPKPYQPSITSLDHAIRLLRAADKLEIEYAVKPIHDAIASITEAEPNPVRAWAIAARFGINAAIKAATVRYLKCNDEAMLEERVEELCHVDGLSHFDFITKRKNALKEAKVAIAETNWRCNDCQGAPAWRKQYERRIAGVNPFGGDVSSELLFEVCALRSGCDNCVSTLDYHHAIAVCSRLRSRLQSILNQHSEIGATFKPKPSRAY
ncbi:uncharacterized protein EI90DRAFT_2084567 [Cantharellus anzutake]|uniref:uncharacterized protein n=1 Tax=Cantharellus anzutake TaxID=1750568 RepID=UPI0019042D38|nr:uncharacterized protein EI90DRAFT_2084567 [Cantharellus anzutake]KAF8340587.1 hypothetical protein EI90DRAFT_2084567 [Cantharellus anzutake]